LTLIATGSEVSLAVEAATLLEGRGIATRVVSMPSWELFESQEQSYREEVLPPACTARVSIEAGATLGWSRYTGDCGINIGIDRFGASAPGGVVFRELGFTAEAVAGRAAALVEGA
jgi:transketolase